MQGRLLGGLFLAPWRAFLALNEALRRFRRSRLEKRT
jgi:hypothetical protein